MDLKNQPSPNFNKNGGDENGVYYKAQIATTSSRQKPAGKTDTSSQHKKLKMHVKSKSDVRAGGLGAMAKSHLNNHGNNQVTNQFSGFDPSYPEEDGIFRVNSLQVDNVNREELAQGTQPLLQMTAQANKHNQRGFGIPDELLSPASGETFSTAPNDQAQTNQQVMSDQSVPQEEPGTFEMGYITFFPKNNNDNFESIPEQAPPEPHELKPPD